MAHEIRAWITLVVAVAAVIAGLLQWHASVDATKANAKIAQEQQTAAFQLEAARIVMEQPTCKTAATREALVVKLFPNLKSAFKRRIVPLFDCQPPAKLTFSPAIFNNLPNNKAYLVKGLTKDDLEAILGPIGKKLKK